MPRRNVAKGLLVAVGKTLDNVPEQIPTVDETVRRPGFTNPVHGFGEDAAGELYALVTNTPANGTGGIVYQITAVPEPATWISIGAGALVLLTIARRRRANVRTP
jgi:PEP-CTERM motif